MLSGRMPDDFYDDIHAFASRTRQRPEWLALIKEPPMRHASRAVVGSPTARVAAFAAATLLITLLSAGALVAGAQSPDPSPPTPDPMAAVAVTGTLGYFGVTSGQFTVLDGVRQERGLAAFADMVTSSDPRLGGVFSYVENKDVYPGDIMVGASRTEIRSDDGAWVGTGTEYAPEGDLETLILAGEGAYAGLTAYLLIDWGTLGRPFTGIIFPGEMPEPPPAP